MDCSTCLARHRELRFLMELYIYLRSGCRDADSVERLAERVRGADLALWSHQRQPARGYGRPEAHVWRRPRRYHTRAANLPAAR